MWGRCVVAILGGLLLGPAAAQAADMAYVNSNGVVVVQGDTSPNQINFAEGASDPNTGYQYGAAIWDSASGESVTAGNGCMTGDPAWSQPGVVECHGFGPTAIQINEGSGAGDTITNHTGLWGTPGALCNNCDTYFTSITINAGNGGDTINPVADNDRTGSTVTVNGGAGSDTITIGSNSTNASTLTLNGGAGDDTITGANGCTCTENINGAAGNNSITTGDGHTVNVTVGAGDSSIVAGQGNDTINTYNGYRDHVACDALGSTYLIADQYDVVNNNGVDCAKVTIKQWGAPPPRTTVSLSLPAHQHPIKSRKVFATVGCSAACYMAAVGQVEIGRAKPFEISSNLFHLRHAGAKTIALPLSSHQLSLIKAGLRAHKRVIATIIGALTDSSGQQLKGHSSHQTLTIKS